MGSVFNLERMRRKDGWHRSMLQKANDETDNHDIDPLFEKFPVSRAVLVDKGYQEARNDMRAIHLVKKTPGSRLTHEKPSFNANVPSDRVIVERYFRKEVCLWATSHR